MSYRGPGILPDDARHVTNIKCDRCNGTPECSHCGDPATIDANEDAPFDLPPYWICERCAEAAWDRQQERLSEESP